MLCLHVLFVKPLKHVVGVLFLPGLDIFAAEDDIVMIRVGIHPEIVIRVAGDVSTLFRTKNLVGF